MNLTEEINSINILIEQIQNDPEKMVVAAIAISVSLFIILSLSILSSIISALKRRIFKEKAEKLIHIKEIHKLTREVKVYDRRLSKDKEDLKKYEQLKKDYMKREDDIRKLKKQKRDVVKEKEFINNKNKELHKMYDKSLTEIKAVKRRNEELINDRKNKSS